jgi:hypothetical protein
LARYFRFYGKKRRQRRTGSEQIGYAGTALFFALCLLIGIGLLIVILSSLILPQWQVNYEFDATTCVVRERRVAESDDKDDKRYRPEILIEYTVAEKEYRQWAYDIEKNYSSDAQRQQELIQQFEVGGEYPCWYDPHAPRRVVLARGLLWTAWLLLLLPVSLIMIGGGGLTYSLINMGKSAERRAAISHRRTQRELFEYDPPLISEYPSVPGDTNLTNSPGTHLPFRLPIQRSAAWSLLITSTVALVVNTIVAGFAVAAIQAHIHGDPDWMMSLFVVSLMVVGLTSLFYLARQLIMAASIGPTSVEISDHPLYPDQQYQVYLSQAGRLKISSLELHLVCEEKSTFRQGTNSRTYVRRVYQDEMLRRDSFRVDQGMPFEVECKLCIPSQAMHSFKGAHNEVNWKLVVTERFTRWPEILREFPVVVFPPQDGEASP